jgi:uncharacterized protein (TIGR02246 family)
MRERRLVVHRPPRSALAPVLDLAMSSGNLTGRYSRDRWIPRRAVREETEMTEDRAADEAAIETVLADSYRAWAAGDADAMVADYTPDATAILPGSRRLGRDAIRDSRARRFAGPLRGTSTWNGHVSHRFLGRDAAVVVSESATLFDGATTAPESGRVNATWVLEKKDGSWKIAAYHNSPVLVPAAVSTV